MSDRVLLVDDDEDLRTMLCEGLRRRGLEVEMVDSAQACLKRLDQVGFDVVVTDVEMPGGMSGIELCRMLSHRMPPLSTIVVTGLRDLKTMTAALASGALEFLSKPINVSALEDAIRRALGVTVPAPALA